MGYIQIQECFFYMLASLCEKKFRLQYRTVYLSELFCSLLEFGIVQLSIVTDSSLQCIQCILRCFVQLAGVFRACQHFVQSTIRINLHRALVGWTQNIFALAVYSSSLVKNITNYEEITAIFHVAQAAFSLNRPIQSLSCDIRGLCVNVSVCLCHRGNPASW